MSAARLSEESGSGTSWLVGGAGEENLASGKVEHQDLAEAPPVARQVAGRMSRALGKAWLPASESDTIGRVVVITGAGLAGQPTTAALLQALGLKAEVDGRVLLTEANVTPKNFSQTSAGFCYIGQEDDEYDREDPNRSKVLATTAIMCVELSEHFELNFSDEIVCAPVLYGGRAADGNVVAVLSMRVWT